VDPQDFEATVFVWHADINFTVEPPRAAQRWVDSVGPVGRANNHNLATPLDTVHESKQLSYHSLFDLTLRLLAVGGDRIYLIDEQNSRLVLFALFEGLPQVFFGLALHFGHDLWTIQAVEERTGFVRDGSGDQGFAAARGSV
jgi:hypothetical protein